MPADHAGSSGSGRPRRDAGILNGLRADVDRDHGVSRVHNASDAGQRRDGGDAEAPSGAAEAALFTDNGDVPPANVDATEPSPSRPQDPYAPSPEDEARLGALAREAFDALMAGDPSTAVEHLTVAQTVHGWTQSAYAAEILFWLGHAYDQLGERTAAMASFRRLLVRYPTSAYADRARRRLTDLESRIGPPQD